MSSLTKSDAEDDLVRQQLHSSIGGYLVATGVHPHLLDWNCPYEEENRPLFKDLFGEGFLLAIPLHEKELQYVRMLLDTDLTFLAILAKYGCTARVEDLGVSLTLPLSTGLAGFSVFLVVCR